MNESLPQAPGAAPVAAPAGGPGERLKAARARRALAIEHVAAALHVDARLIEAMETDRFGAFDAPVYARGFLSKYARFLELPPDELLAAYDALHLNPVAPTLIPVGVGRVVARDWSRWLMAAAMLGAVVVVGGSYWWWLARAPKVAANVAPPAPAPEVVVATPAPAAAAAATIVPPPVAPAATPPRRHESPPAPRPVLAASGREDELVIRGSGECWVEVYGPTGARLYFDMVRDGETRRLPGPGPWRVFLGYVDAAHLSVGDRAVVIPASRKTAATARVVIASDGAVR